METSKDHAEHRARRFADGWYAIHFCHECQQEAVNARAKMKELVKVSPRIVRDGDGDVWMHMPNVHLNLSLQGGPIIRQNLLAWAERMQSALCEVEAILGGK